MPPLSMPKDFSSVMAAACLDDPDAIEQVTTRKKHRFPDV
jgi:hypothetical protein